MRAACCTDGWAAAADDDERTNGFGAPAESARHCMRAPSGRRPIGATRSVRRAAATRSVQHATNLFPSAGADSPSAATASTARAVRIIHPPALPEIENPSTHTPLCVPWLSRRLHGSACHRTRCSSGTALRLCCAVPRVSYLVCPAARAAAPAHARHRRTCTHARRTRRPCERARAHALCFAAALSHTGAACAPPPAGPSALPPASFSTVPLLVCTQSSSSPGLHWFGGAKARPSAAPVGAHEYSRGLSESPWEARRPAATILCPVGRRERPTPMLNGWADGTG